MSRRRAVLGAVAGLAVLGSLAPASWAAEPGVTRREIVVGAATALSGPLGAVAEQVTKFGVDIAVKALNEAGGLHGRAVRTVWRDDGGRPDQARAATARLIADDRVFAILAPLGAVSVAAMADEVGERQVPLLLPADGSPSLRGRRWVVPGAMLYDRQSRLAIDYLRGQRNMTRIAILYQGDAYGRMFRGLLEAELARHGLRPVAAVPVDWAAAAIGPPVARVRAARPEATLMAVTPRPAAEVIKEQRKLGWKQVLVALGPLADERYLTIAGPIADGVEALALWPDPARSELPGVVRYREELQRRAPTVEPNRASLAGYFAGLLFAEAARRSGSDPTRQALMTAVEGLTGWDSGIVPPLTIGADHEVHTHAQWTRLERGRLTPITDWLDAKASR